MNKIIEKEYGSFCHAVDVNKTRNRWCESADPVFMGSGRDALYAVLSDIKNKSKCEIKRIWLPSYYCHSVTHILESYFEICIYEARANFPAVISTELSKNDLLIVLEYFGHKANLSFDGSPWVVLDKTHNPVSSFNYSFNVDFVFGSLRKILPVADGGFYFSRSNHNEVSSKWPVTREHTLSFSLINKAMLLKAKYLEFGEGLKQEFLSLHAQGESQVGDKIIPSGMIICNELVQYADMHYYLFQRTKNNILLKSLINNYNFPFEVVDSHLFFIILFHTESNRDFYRSKLIEEKIYPAVLWPIDSKYMLSDDKGLSRRTLVLPTDFRYAECDMEYIIKALSKILEMSDVCQV